MDWVKDGVGNRNPVVVIGGNKRLEILTDRSQPGTTVTLDASGSHDPDGDELRYKWWVLSAAGTYAQDVKLLNSDASIASIEVPSDSAGKTFHVICEVTDDGTHSLTGYRRIIFEPTE